MQDESTLLALLLQILNDLWEEKVKVRTQAMAYDSKYMWVISYTRKNNFDLGPYLSL